MKRLAWLILLLPTAAFGAARTASVDGLWNATATWGGAAVPTLSDSCTISSGIEVVCDTDPCQCGDLTINGLLTMKDGARTLKVGNATGVASDGDITIATTGTLIGGVGHDIEFNLDRSAEVDCGVLTNNGTFIWTGNRLVESGTIMSVGAISGSWPTRKIVLTDTGIQQPVVDYYSGKYLVPTSGYFRNHFFTITTGGTTTSDIAVLVDDRGAMDSRDVAGRITAGDGNNVWAPGDWGSIIYRADASADDVILESASTAVTFDAGIFADTATATRVLLGSRIICEADLNTAADADIRRICSVASATAATLCTAYGTVSCASPGAGFFVFDDNQPPKHVIIQEAFTAGDGYDIIDPAMISITSANRSDTAPNDHYNIVIADASNTLLRDITIDYCGQDLDGGSSSLEPSCIQVSNINNLLDSEQFLITRADIWHFSGENAIYLIDTANITVERVNIHDCSEGGENDNHECHGIYTESNSDGASGIVVRNNRIKGANDGAIVFSGGATSGILCTDCSVNNNWVGMMPGNGVLGGGSVQGIVSTNSMVNTSIADNFVTNVEDLSIYIAPTDTSPSSVSSIGVSGNLILNTQVSTAVTLGLYNASTGVPDSLSKNAMTNNAIIGFMVGPVRGYQWSNFMAGLNVISNSVLAGCGYGTQSAIGNICLAPGGSSGGAPIGWSSEPTSAGLASMSPTTSVFRDNVAYGSTTPAASGTAYTFLKQAANSVTGPLYTIDHNTIVCHETSTTASDQRGVQTAPSVSGTVTVSNNVAYDCHRLIHEAAAGAGGTTASSYNLKLLTGADSGVDSTSNDLTTGTISFRQMAAGDLSSLKGSTPWSSLGSDSYPRGSRVAGPPFPRRFRRLYPFPLVVDNTGLAVHSASDTSVIHIINANTVGDKDTDGDGVWDLHDNCDRTWNPSQYDPDGDGKGCVCDAGETCS